MTTVAPLIGTARAPFRLDVAGLELSLGGRQVLSDVSLTVTEHRLGIVGRNGSGKSTLARLIAGLIAPDAGRVRINGIDVLKDRRGALRSVGILFQNPDHQIIFPTVEEELSFGLRQMGQSKRAARDIARDTLRKFDRADWAERSVATLSQGQRHLVCLMAVLAMEPAVIILDEPFSGLDIPTTRALHRHLAAIAPALIHITHDPVTIADYDRVIWIDDGRIRADGLPASVLDTFATEMTRLTEQEASCLL
ncbi:MAG: ABC transporter ATP-binding protein [Celeribacter sp.]